MLSLRFDLLLPGLLLLSHSVQAQLSMPVDWTMLADPEAQQFEDPYRDLSQSQFESLMSLARLQIAMGGELAEAERAAISERASELSQNLQAQGLDPEWILAQREAVAERRQRAALSTNPDLDGESIELTGYLLVASDVEDGAMATVAYLLPDRSVCNHLPPPQPNQLVRLLIKNVPETGGYCVPAVIQGTFHAEETRHEVVVIDHSLSMWSAWTLETDAIQTADSSKSEETPQQ